MPSPPPPVLTDDVRACRTSRGFRNSAIPKPQHLHEDGQTGAPDTNIPKKRGGFPNLALSFQTLAGPSDPPEIRKFRNYGIQEFLNFSEVRFLTDPDLVVSSQSCQTSHFSPYVSRPSESPGNSEIPKFRDFGISECQNFLDVLISTHLVVSPRSFRILPLPPRRCPVFRIPEARTIPDLVASSQS